MKNFLQNISWTMQGIFWIIGLLTVPAITIFIFILRYGFLSEESLSK